MDDRRRIDRLKREAERGDIEALRQLLTWARRRHDDPERWARRLAVAAQEAQDWPALDLALESCDEPWLRERYPVLATDALGWRFGLRTARALLPDLWRPWWLRAINPLKVTADPLDYTRWAPVWALTFDPTPRSLDDLIEDARPHTPNASIHRRKAWRFLKKSGLIQRLPGRSLALASELPALPALPRCADCADTGSCPDCGGRRLLDDDIPCETCEAMGSCPACRREAEDDETQPTRRRSARYIRQPRVRNIPRLRKRSTARRRRLRE